MAYDLQEQESIDQMKAWWDRWGTPVTAAVCVVCLGFAGWNGWNWYKRNQAAEASVAYVQLQNAVFHKDVKNVASLTSGLIENYGGTVYAPLAAFGAAQTALEAGNFAEAAAMLNWVIDKSGHQAHRRRTLARQRPTRRRLARQGRRRQGPGPLGRTSQDGRSQRSDSSHRGIQARCASARSLTDGPGRNVPGFAFSVLSKCFGRARFAKVLRTRTPRGPALDS